MSEKPPRLLLPEAEAQKLCAAYATADVILEYGSGGSTLVGAALPGKVIQAVESDAEWLKRIADWFADHPPLADLRLHHADIGPTKAWGYPVNKNDAQKWPGYALSVWRRDDFVHPDCVLIDGRFRLACFLAVIGNITRPATVLWDDYVDRPAYHRAEDLAKPVEVIGRMARFDLQPTSVEALRQEWMIEAFVQPG